MIANLIGRTILPEPTLSDEIFGRLYYVASSCLDTVQTVVKIARSIFTSGLAFVFLGQSPLLNKASQLSWDDVGFSLQMTGYSLLGILSPRQAWLKKCESHISNAMSGKGLDFTDFLLEEWGTVKSVGIRTFLAGQMVESGVRYAAAHIRFFAARLMYALSFENAKFVEFLGQGAYNSADFASQEINLISRTMSHNLEL